MSFRKPSQRADCKRNEDIKEMGATYQNNNIVRRNN
jgi:hypothetical protein